LASGVDALYLSGRASLRSDLIGVLEIARSEAGHSRKAVPIELGGVEVSVAPHAFGRYRFSLDHPYGRIGLTASSTLPAIRVQPRTEFLQGAGPRGAVEWFRNVLEDACGPVRLSVNRLDLFGDFQGWRLSGDARHEFVCRAQSRHTYEEDGIFNGLIFGRRESGTVLARIYDKTIESTKSGSGLWPMIWGDAYECDEPVLRVEFELGRNALREYGLTTPEETLDAAGAVWSSLTGEWLSHRVPCSDQTRSRWPVSSSWEAVRRARIGETSFGISRMYLGKRRGGVAGIMPMLAGYLASFGAYAEASDFDHLLPHLSDALKRYERDHGISLSERIADKRRKFGLL